MTPQILSLTREASDTVRLVWRGEAERLYGVKTTLNSVKSPWTNFRFSTGSFAIRATNDVVGATGAVSPADPARYFRVFEAD